MTDKGTEQWVSAYLEWIEVQDGEPASEEWMFVERRRSDRRAGIPGASREDVLLVALRMESDVRLLREALDTSREPFAGLRR